MLSRVLREQSAPKRCVCQQPDDEAKPRSMVQCHLRGACHDKSRTTSWFHLDCVGLTEENVNDVGEWWCPKCRNLREDDDDRGKSDFPLVTFTLRSLPAAF